MGMLKAKLAPQDDEEVISIASLAAECLHEANGDVQKATALMEAKARSNRAIKAALLEPLLSYACFEACKRSMRSARRAIWSPPVHSGSGGTVTGQAGRVQSLATSNLMMFPLRNGLPLGRATLEDVRESATFYAAQGEDMVRKGRWLALIAARIPEGKTVSQSLTEADLRTMQAEVSNA